MNNKEKAYYIISKLDFNNLEVNTKPSAIIDNNKSVNLNWTVSEVSGGEIKESSGIKVLNFRTNNYKIFTTIPINTNIKNDSIQFEANILIPNIKVENIFFNIGASSGTGFRFNIKNTFIGGFEIFYNNKKITFNYKFENNVNYHILVTKEYNVYSFYINGLIIGNCVSDDFNNSITLSGTSLNLTIGAKSSAYSSASDEFNGEISNVNISVSPQKEYLKYNKSFTKYGENLVSRLNFGNLASTSNTTVFTANLEAVTDSKMNWSYGNLTIKDEYATVDGTPFESNISNINTIYFTVNNNNKIYNEIELLSLNNNYKIIYTSDFEGEPEPDVVVNENTTSALNFENGLNDKVSTTVWNKDGTSDITSANKIFGENSFETKALGDSLYTNSNVITGGSTPFTIEFYALIKGQVGWADNNEKHLPLLSKNNFNGGGDQLFAINQAVGNKIEYYRGTNVGGELRYRGFETINFNEINKYTITYDGSACRIFINDKLDKVFGINTSPITMSNSHSFTFFDSLVSSFPTYRRGTLGIIDNINIHNGIATKVREPDPYEEYLVVDLAFDGENNSTKIVDNGIDKSTNWSAMGGAILSTTNKFDGFSSLYLNGSSYIEHVSNPNKFNFSGYDDFSISFKFITTESHRGYIFHQNENPSYIDGIQIYVYNNTLYILGYKGTTKCLDISYVYTSNNKEFSVNIIRKNMVVYLYINNVMVNNYNMTEPMGYVESNIRIGGAKPNDNDPYFNWKFKGYIKNFKIYKDVAVIPEDPTGKIQLDFDNNVNDKYNNSTWNNTGLTFNNIHSISGYSGYFNYNNTKLTCNSELLNLTDHSGYISFDINLINKNTSIGWDTVITSGDNSNKEDRCALEFSISSENFIRHRVSSTLRNDAPINYVTNTFYNINLIKNLNNSILFINDCPLSLINSNLLNFNSSNLCTIGGSLSNSSESINGYIDNFKSYKEDLVNQTLNIPSPSGTTNYNIVNDCLDITFTGTVVDSGTSESTRTTIVYHDSPILSNFKAELVIYIKNDSYNYGGITFRTITHSKNSANYFGYSAYLTGNKLRLGKGSNNTTVNNWVQLGNYELSSTEANNKFHTLKVIANNDLIQVYLDNVLKIQVTDSTYNYASCFATHTFFFNTAILTRLKSFDVYDLEDNHLYHKDWKKKNIDYIISKPILHLPLESNVTNIGFGNLKVDASGVPTYHNIDDKKCIKFESGKYISVTGNNNIFQVGNKNDFYIEFDFYIDDESGNVNISNNVNTSSTLVAIICQSHLFNDTSGMNRQGKCYFYVDGNPIIITDNTTLIKTWNNLVLKRYDDKITLTLNGISKTIDNIQNPLDFSLNGSLNFCKGTWYSSSNYGDGKGYMTNFKMFVGTSEIPETYNDKKVLDLDFAPTGKSYLFKDNNNKCIIHPVNITQRDYQYRQYCCKFNGTNQYLQLGKNDLLNFGNDDFIINIKFKSNIINGWHMLLCDAAFSTNFIDIGSSGFLAVKLGGLRYDTPVGSIVADTIYDVIIQVINSEAKVYINGEQTTLDGMPSRIVNNVNFNLSNNTYIGCYLGNSEYFNGAIYSIKILRNTNDLSLLEEELTIIESSEKYILTNGEEAEEISFTEIKERDIKVINDNDKITFKIDDNEVELAKTTEVDNIKLFDGYTSQVKDVHVYDIAMYDDDEFLGSGLIDTQYPELEIYDDSDIQELQVIDVGEYVIKGFIEGGVDRKYIIRNKVENFDLLKGSGDYYYDGIDERYIDDYEIYEIESKQRYPLYKHEMKKGFISGSVNLANCGLKKGQKLKVYCYRNDTQRLIGIYELDDYNRYEIPNLDVNSKYDIIFKDDSRKIENISSSYRTPKEY